MPHGDLDRNLNQAAARSREIAAILAAKHEDPSGRYRRIAVLAGGSVVAIALLLLALFAAFGAKRPGAERRSEPAQEIDNSHYLSPLRTAKAGPGEETAPFSGFAISVETEPPGGIVTIAGVPRGEAPVLANVECAPGAPLEIAAEKAGFRPGRVETSCREDTLVKVTVRLVR